MFIRGNGITRANTLTEYQGISETTLDENIHISSQHCHWQIFLSKVVLKSEKNQTSKKFKLQKNSRCSNWEKPTFENLELNFGFTKKNF